MNERGVSGWTPPRGLSRREALRISGLVALAAGGWSLSGCGIVDAGDVGAKSGASGDGARNGPAVLRISFVPVDVLDPQVITNGMWILTRGILEGLVSQNDKGNGVLPAVATKWSVSP